MGFGSLPLNRWQAAEAKSAFDRNAATWATSLSLFRIPVFVQSGQPAWRAAKQFFQRVQFHWNATNPPMVHQLVPDQDKKS
jgi:hypothetical protein